MSPGVRIEFVDKVFHRLFKNLLVILMSIEQKCESRRTSEKSRMAENISAVFIEPFYRIIHSHLKSPEHYGDEAANFSYGETC